MAEIIKQTAVEWFANESWQLKVQLENEEISVDEYAVSYVRLLYKAKEMEKQQIINAYTEGVEEENKMDVFNDHPQHWACEYSHRTYGNIYGREK